MLRNEQNQWYCESHLQEWFVNSSRMTRSYFCIIKLKVIWNYIWNKDNMATIMKIKINNWNLRHDERCKCITCADASEVSSGYNAKKAADRCRLSFSAAHENCLPHTQNTVLQPSPLAIAMQHEGQDITVWSSDDVFSSQLFRSWKSCHNHNYH